MSIPTTVQRLLLPLAGALLAGHAAADVIVVTQLNFTFDPADIVVQLGDTVRWEWTGGGHDVTEGDDGSVDGDEAFFGPLDSNNPTFEVTFDAALLNAFPRPGDVYQYFCSPHFFLNMKGTVTVLTEPGTPYCECGTAAAPCMNPGGPGEGCANSTGSGAVLSAGGSASVGADDLEFSATNLLPNQPALLFVGLNATNGGAGVTFGDGLRCAGGSVVRLGVQVPSAAGEAGWGPGLGGAGGWSSGDTRRFQVWYRNPGGSPCGAGFNLTNGYEVAFGD
jgi:plastocyanin